MEDSVGSDDITVEHGLPSQSQRMSVMISVPDKDVDEDDAPFEAIKKLNNMISCLINKVPSVRIGPWNNGKKVTTKQLLIKLPDDIDITERYTYNFNRFISPGDRAYCRLQIYFGDETSLGEIENVTQSFKKPRVQFFQPAHSDAPNPVIMGTLTGSVKDMTTSPDFYNAFKSMFGLKFLGLFWTQPRSENSGKFSSTKMSLSYEIDRSDMDKNDDILNYFNKYSKKVDDNFLERR